jgi:hypothetical protein
MLLAILQREVNFVVGKIILNECALKSIQNLEYTADTYLTSYVRSYIHASIHIDSYKSI